MSKRKMEDWEEDSYDDYSENDSLEYEEDDSQFIIEETASIALPLTSRKERPAWPHPELRDSNS